MVVKTLIHLHASSAYYMEDMHGVSTYEPGQRTLSGMHVTREPAYAG